MQKYRRRLTWQLILISLLVEVFPFNAALSHVAPSQTRYVSHYGDVADIVKAISKRKCLLVIESNQLVSADLTIPSTISVRVEKGSVITVASGRKLTINGPFQAGLYKTFAGEGTVSFGVIVNEVFPEWWETNVTPGTTDMTDAIQAAINSTNGHVVFSATTYGLNIDTAIGLEAGATTCSLIMKSNMHLKGVPGKSILKLLDNQSSNADPRMFNILATNDALKNISMDGLVFDLNGVNNLTNKNNTNSAAVIISGSADTVGQDAYVRNLKITNCLFKNTPGTSVIVIGQSNSGGPLYPARTPVVLSENVEIAHNVFWNNGLDSSDHSSIYAWAESVDIHDNLFVQDVMSRGSMAVMYPAPLSNKYTGPYVACEIHGAKTRFINNTIHNYWQGLYIACNYTSPVYEVLVSRNQFYVNQSAMEFFRESSHEKEIADVVIVGNTIYISGDVAVPTNPKVGIGVRASYGADRVTVTNNRLYSADTNGAIGIAINNLQAGTSLTNILIANNSIDTFSLGIVHLGGGKAAVIDAVYIKGNTISDLVDSTLYRIAIGISVRGVASLGLVEITNNTFAQLTAFPATSYGIYLDGAIERLIVEGNVYSGYQERDAGY